jgi:integrase
MPTERTLTWDKAGQRWKRVYRGKVFYGERGVKKSDRQAYQVAVEQFNAHKSEVDRQADADKPHAAEYQQAIRLRQEAVKWLDLEHNEADHNALVAEMKRAGGDTDGILDFHAERDRLVAELERLNIDFARNNPPPLNAAGKPTVDPFALRPIRYRMLWLDRVEALRQHDKWNGATDQSKTITANITSFLAVKQQQAEAGQIAFGWFSVMRYHLDHYRKFAGELAVSSINAQSLANYHAHLLREIKAGKITTTYGKQLLGSVKSYVRWLWENEIIDGLPRNLAKLAITADAPTIKTLTAKEIKTLTAKAKGRTRLYILLMLNTGMTGQDISDLKPTEVNWEEGRIVRRRSKTKRQKNVPIVNYRLWKETFDLLKQYGRQKGERVFLNKNGLPLRRWEAKDNGKPRNIDNVRSAYGKLTDQPLKLIRKTGSSTLATHPTYGQFAFLYLGHSPKTTSERHYTAIPQELFDQAIVWLGKQFGIS